MKKEQRCALAFKKIGRAFFVWVVAEFIFVIIDAIIFQERAQSAESSGYVAFAFAALTVPVVIVFLFFKINSRSSLYKNKNSNLVEASGPLCLTVSESPMLDAKALSVKYEGSQIFESVIDQDAESYRSVTNNGSEPGLLEIDATLVATPKMSHKEYAAMRQQNLERLETSYDFSSVAGIAAIPGPSEEFKIKESRHDFTGRVEYHLLSKGEQYKKSKQQELALACFRKANELMPMYGDFYSRDYYERLPRYLRMLRRFDEAREEELRIQRLFGGDFRYIGERFWPAKRRFNLLRSIEIMQTDLVQATYTPCCCDQCAKYRGRVYSYSGNDSRFKKLPDFLLNSEHNCGISLLAFSLGTSSLGVANGGSISAENVQEIIKYSNRKFLDDRTPEELRNFDKACLRKTADIERKKARADYDWIWEFLPEICPKSFSAYMRIKNAKSEKFAEIASEARENGREIAQ